MKIKALSLRTFAVISTIIMIIFTTSLTFAGGCLEFETKSATPPSKLMGTTSLGNKVYAATEGDGQFFVYDPSSDTWTQKTSLPTPVSGAVVQAVNGKVYVIGGNSALNQMYDPQTDTWSTKAPIPTARHCAMSMVYNGKIYVIGGEAGVYHPTNVVEIYDPSSDTWTTGAPMPTARSSAAIAEYSGEWYVISGYGGGYGVFYTEVEKYNPQTDTWTSLSPTPYGVRHAQALVLNNKIYCIGGKGYNTDWFWPDILIYDPASDSWSTCVSNTFVKRDNAVSAQMGNSFYIFGGTDSDGDIAPTQVFNPSTPPVISSLIATPQSGTAPLQVQVSCNATDSDGTITEYRFDFDSDGHIDEVTQTGSTTHTYDQPGTYNLTCTVVDNDGNTTTSNPVKITVGENQPPVIDNLTVTPQSGTAPLQVQVSCSATDSDGTITQYCFDFGDATDLLCSESPTADHTFTQPGTYTIKCTVKDNLGANATKSTNVTVTSPQYSVALISPTNHQCITYGTSNGQLNFSFSSLVNAKAYILNLVLRDMVAQADIPLQILLIPVSSDNPWVQPTPGFSISPLGVATYTVSLDTATWDALALYKLSWNIDALSNPQDVSSVIASSDTWCLKLQPSQSVTLVSPTDGDTLYKSTDNPPEFNWQPYQGAATYTLVLAHVGSLGFDYALTYPDQILNVFPMDSTTWQSMPEGTWYWTVLAEDGNGTLLTPNFPIFSFEVQESPPQLPIESNFISFPHSMSPDWRP